MAVPFGLRGLLLHLKLHQVKVVDVLDGQGAGGQLCAHGEVGGHVSPCDDSRPHSQTDRGQPSRIQIAKGNNSLYGVYIGARTRPVRGAAAGPVGGRRNLLRLLVPETTSIYSDVDMHVNELVHLPAPLAALVDNLSRVRWTLSYQEPPQRLKLERA